MALRSGYKGFKKLLGLKMIRPGTLAVDDAVLSETFFPRSEQAVLGARNWFSTNNIASGANLVTITDKGKAINVKNTTAGAYQMVNFDMPCEKNTDYTFTVDIDYVSGAGEIIISDIAESDVLARINSDVKADRSWSASFNTGNHTSIRFRMYCTRATSETGEINFNNTLLKLASDTDTSWSAFAMTNRELTDALADTGWENATLNDTNVQSGYVKYRVKAGICYVIIDALQMKNAGDGQTVATGLPLADGSIYSVDAIASASASAPLGNGFYVTNNSGNLTGHIKSTSSCYASFSYIVKES